MTQYEATSPGELSEVEDPQSRSATNDVEIIMEARRQCHEVRNEARDLEYRGAPRKARAYYYSTVKGYAIAMAPFVISEEFGDKELWEDAELYTKRVSPPDLDELQQHGSINTDRVWEDSLRITGGQKGIKIRGIKGFLRLQPPVKIRFNYEIESPAAGCRSGTYAKSHVPPIRVGDAVVTKLDEFRRGIGLGLSNPDEVGAESPEAY